ncbi:homeobox domain-containing protein [Aspergillus lucknowensis]|uniref:Homeobox domain-containing protein n=1 Tax=Aspergillus lucknowensis TaxID=176173 RepID=A0ABR4M637_9EURO
MNYIHHPYPFASHSGIPMEQPIAYDPAMVHPTMMQPMDGYLYPHPPFDMVDFYHQPIMDYEEYAENLSRPRLTKEQVETLEAQFQAHPKPSSNVKRQLAAQTNLSLPRVANWFQNRRAKAKQQKRQEEYERMQKAEAQAEEAAKAKSEPSDPEFAESNEKKLKLDNKDDATPRTSDTNASSNKKQTSNSPSGLKHQQTRNESAREASLASLQRALNAATGLQYSQDGQSATNADESVSPTTVLSKEADAVWGSVASTGGLTAAPLENQQSLSDYRSASDAEIPYNSMQYALQADVAVSRRGSSDALADSLEGIGINASSHGLPQLGNRTDMAPAWKEAGKELDLAARRKRPRPAAIGTSRSSSMLSGSSTMSPTTRLPSYGTVKQSKSAQNLNTRYAGVRKASTQRSPLNLSTFAEAGVLSSAKTEMSTMLQPVTTSTLAPPTPLTPEELHHLLPNTPSTDGYCLSAGPTSHFFSTTQPMQINLASPPATPLGMEMISPYQYQGVAPPMSAPAHFTSFPDYTCEGGLDARSWEGASMPSPEASFQSHCRVDMSSMPYRQALEDHSESASPFCTTSEADLNTSGDIKTTEFHLYEFPDQEEAHRFVAQQLPSQKPKEYTFAEHRTPNNFG